MLLEVDIDGDIYVLVNFYNNIESYKLHTSELNNFLNKVADISRRWFQLIFWSLIETEGSNPILKKILLAKIIELLENCDLCDIWRIRSTKTTFFMINVEAFGLFFHFRYSARVHETYWHPCFCFLSFASSNLSYEKCYSTKRKRFIEIRPLLTTQCKIHRGNDKPYSGFFKEFW